MPTTHLTAANPGSRSRGGGNHFGFQQILRNADGTFAAWSGSDAFGDAALTCHVLGYHQESAWKRDDKGSNQIDFTLLDNDIDHKNLIAIVAPITPKSILKDPDFTSEDGTLLVNAEISGDVTMPYWLFWYMGAPVGGKAQVFVGIGQFMPTDSLTQKPTEWSLHKISFRSVYGNSHVIAGTEWSTDAAMSTLTTGVTLSDPNGQGIWLAGT
jgi:hypothetical protein